MQQDAQVVGGGPVTGRRGGAQMGLGRVQLAAAQQHRPEDTGRLGVPALRGEREPRLLGGLPHVHHLVAGRLRTGRLRKPP
ncbi:hypothetical protein ACFQ3Z_30635 [Streptomyces nogalater]